MRMHVCHLLSQSVSHSVTVTKMQDQNYRYYFGLVWSGQIWLSKVWVVKFDLVRSSLVWFGLVKFYLVPDSIQILIPIRNPVTYPI